MRRIKKRILVIKSKQAEILDLYRTNKQELTPDWKNTKRLAILNKYNRKCVLCSEDNPTKLTIDHIKPKSRGGKNNTSNLQILCKKCNSRKGSHTMKEYLLILKK